MKKEILNRFQAWVVVSVTHFFMDRHVVVIQHKFNLISFMDHNHLQN